MKKIAEIANVSRSTVDKAIHDRPGISDEVRSKVKRIADELGYKPNIIGKALAFQNKPMIIGVIGPKNNFYYELQEGINAAYKELKDFGIEIEDYPMSDVGSEEQLEIIKYFEKKKVSGLIIRPYDHPLISNALNNMIDTGIPVVACSSDIKNCRRLCFVGQDLITAGKVAGGLMGRLLNSKGKVAIITGSYELLALNQRISGFKQVIKDEYPNIEIIDEIETFEKDIFTFEKTLELLQRRDDLNGIYLTAEPVKQVAKAMKKMSKEKEIKLICFDKYPETIKLVKEKVVDITICQDPFMQGYTSVKILFDHIFHNKVPEVDHIKTKIDIRIKENIDLEI